jgi:putative nucleotidyltransferase with HDIG domain
MSIHAFNEAERARVSWARRGEPFPVRARRGELLVGGGYIAAALALVVLAGVHHFSLPVAVLYVVAIAVACHLRFDVGAGYTVPTQAIFVPMLFNVPTAAVPLLMPLALAIGMAPRIARGQISPSWLITAAGNSWFAFGPALVLVIAHDRSPDRVLDVLVLALAAQFVCDFAASAVRERLFGDLSIRELEREYRPVYAIDLALSPLGLAVAFCASAVGSQLAVLMVMPLFGVLQFFSKERRERLQQMALLNDAYQGTALLLGDVVEADDSYTGQHCKSVVRLALDVATELRLDSDRKRQVEFGALLHDIGKIAVPKEIINKPGKLDEREWAIVRMHTVEGQRMLERIGGFMRDVGIIVRASHERWDGAGYPDGLRGEEIPLEARIIAICDAMNAMTTTRSYREAMTLDVAREELERCAGSQFDPHVVSALLRVLDRAEPLEQTQALAGEPPAAERAATEMGRGERELESQRECELITGLAPPAIR